MGTRTAIIAGNWKMNLGRQESIDLATGVADIEHDPDQVELLVFPAMVWTANVSDAVKGSTLRVGAQNCYTEPKGAFTGEVSTGMLAEICTDVMAGHSERRHVFGESDELVGQKVRAILGSGMRAVLCVGETLAEREAGEAEAVVKRQLVAGLAGTGAEELDAIVIAYEPVWAIGTGVSASPEDAQAMCAYVRSELTALYGDIGTNVRVLYGGSVTADNAADLLGQADIDGGLVGGASLNVQSFRAIVEAAARSRE